MTPPGATEAGRLAGVSSSPVALAGLPVLKKRSDFLNAAKARRQAMPGFILQARHRDATEAACGAIRIGYTCSKKVGNAVARNHAKRRLREVARLILPHNGLPGWDYVLIGRRDVTASRDFAALLDDLKAALGRLHS